MKNIVPHLFNCLPCSTSVGNYRKRSQMIPNDPKGSVECVFTTPQSVMLENCNFDAAVCMRFSTTREITLVAAR